MLGRWLPPPRQPVRAMREYQFARHLARKHQLTLAFIADNPDATGAISALRGEFGDLEFASIPRSWKSLASAVRSIAGESCTLSYFRSEALRTRLADRLRRTRYDVIVVSSSGMIPYALEADPAIPLVADFGEVDSVWWGRYAAGGAVSGARFFATEMARLRLVEAALARRAARCIVESPEAASIVRGLAPDAPTTVIPSGVDIEQFAACPGAGSRPTVIFSTPLRDAGEFADAVNFCRTVAPLVRVRVPKVRIVIASKGSVLFGRRSDLVGVEVIAPVADLRPLFHSETVAVAPLRAGRDVRSSVLEPMAAGVPVVATAQVCERLGVTDGRVLCVGGEAADLALAVIQLLQDPGGRAAVAERGRAYVSAAHGWSVAAQKVEEIVNGAIRPRPAADARPGTAGTDLPIGVTTHVSPNGDAR